jgi:hypothetical protein
MAVDCTPNSLEEAAKCFKCIPKGMQSEVMIYLLATIAKESLDPTTLMAKAACFKCIPAGMQSEVQTYLLCQIATASGA